MKLIYLDQNILSIISMETKEKLLQKFHETLNANNYYLAIGFPHVYETAKASEKKRRRIYRTLDCINWIQFRPLIKILDAEVKNEFYRFINSLEKEEETCIGNIFPQLTNQDIPFSQLVDFARNNTQASVFIQNQTKEHDIKMRKLLSTTTSNIENERKAALIYFRDTTLRNRQSTGLSIELPNNCLNDSEFIDGFNWSKAPYLNMYTAFQYYRYRDRNRNPSGELADAENAILGALGTDCLLIEKYSTQILIQLKRTNFPFKAKICNNFNELVDHLGQ